MGPGDIEAHEGPSDGPLCEMSECAGYRDQLEMRIHNLEDQLAAKGSMLENVSENQRLLMEAKAELQAEIERLKAELERCPAGCMNQACACPDYSALNDMLQSANLQVGLMRPVLEALEELKKTSDALSKAWKAVDWDADEPDTKAYDAASEAQDKAWGALDKAFDAYKAGVAEKRINDTSPKARQITPEEFAEGLGAKPMTPEEAAFWQRKHGPGSL
ncbi:MAG TPA: hypothetical protein VEA41_17495 [Salinarimonas sp.]|nr:hypothetical protein [Salinarimonas sp.]